TERLKHLAEALIVEEEKKLVFEDRPADVEAELIAVEGGFLEGDGGAGVADRQGFEEACGVEVGVADELVHGGVEAVGSALRCDVNGCTGGAAILGALVIGYYLELSDGVGRDGDDLVVESL